MKSNIIALALGIALVLALSAGVARAEDELAVTQDYDPWAGFNEPLLQGRVGDAGTEVGRFVVNTTAGVGGFVDVAARLHLEPTEADMGEMARLFARNRTDA